MLARWVRTWDSRLLRPLVLGLARLGVTPDGLTLASLALVAASGLVLAQGWLAAGAAVLVAGAALDGLDGELARLQAHESRRGAFLDSIADHYGDLAVHLGLLWLFLATGARLEIGLLVLSLFGSLIGSQVRSRAGMLGLDVRDAGLVTRFERVLLLAAGLLAGRPGLALGALAVLNNAAALQRLARVLRATRGPAIDSQGQKPYNTQQSIDQSVDQDE